MLLRSRPEAGARTELQPITAAVLPEVAAFLGRARHDDVLGTERYLRWLLVDNPLASSVERHGLCARDASGRLAGVLLSFPAAFRAGEQRLRALGSAGYFVTPEARSLGFFLFKRHVATPGYAFFFSTTCNTTSGALWKLLGGAAVPGSDVEYVIPFRLDVLFPAFLDGRTGQGHGAGLAALVGRCANPALRSLVGKASRLVLEPSRDWDKLAALARRHRAAERLTPERSAEYLQWRYGDDAPNRPFDLVIVRDAAGEEGWFALGSVVRGRHGQVRARVVLDAVWPRERMRAGDVLAAAAMVAAPAVDVLYMQPPCGLDACWRSGAVPWRLAGPRVFVITGRGHAPLATEAIDLVPAAGDGAF